MTVGARQGVHSSIKSARPGGVGVLMIMAALSGLTFRAAAEPGKGLSPEREVTAGTRHALVLGNQAYARMPLSNPLRDARAVSARLEQLGFTVTTRTDLGLKQMERTVDAFLSEVRVGDVALVYYSGHGVQVDGINYLVPVDFDAHDEKDVKYDAFPLDKLMDKLGDRNLALTVVVLDACRDNPFRGKKGGARGLAGVNAARGTLVAYATAPGSTALDGEDGGNGVYTASLLDGLNLEGVDIEAMFSEVRADVARKTNNEQIPWSASSVIGKFYLKERKAPAEHQEVDLSLRQPSESKPGLGAVPLPTSQKSPTLHNLGIAGIVVGGLAVLAAAGLEATAWADAGSLKTTPRSGATAAALGESVNARHIGALGAGPAGLVVLVTGAVLTGVF